MNQVDGVRITNQIPNAFIGIEFACEREIVTAEDQVAQTRIRGWFPLERVPCRHCHSTQPILVTIDDYVVVFAILVIAGLKQNDGRLPAVKPQQGIGKDRPFKTVGWVSFRLQDADETARGIRMIIGKMPVDVFLDFPWRVQLLDREECTFPDIRMYAKIGRLVRERPGEETACPIRQHWLAKTRCPLPPAPDAPHGIWEYGFGSCVRLALSKTQRNFSVAPSISRFAKTGETKPLCSPLACCCSRTFSTLVSEARSGGQVCVLCGKNQRAV